MPGPAVSPAIEARKTRVCTCTSAGWYGKIPALGDFASRRLPPQFISRWDEWLQASIVASRADLQERWEEIYLISPIWRFALMPGLCGERCWAGMMMPSVDKVGRYFPLVIALELPAQPGWLALVMAAQDWFATTEAAALACLTPDDTVEAFEARLLAAPYPQQVAAHAMADDLAAWWSGPASPAQAPALALPGIATIAQVLDAVGLAMLEQAALGKSLWWVSDDMAQTLRLYCCAGFPEASHFTPLLAGATLLNAMP
jgi:type VI secretion system protein ImpM